MKYIKNLQPIWFLRVGLGMMYLYSGFSLFSHPERWLGFLPQWFLDILSLVMTTENYLRTQGVAEMMVGFVFLAWFLKNGSVLLGATIFSILEMFFIVIFVGVDLITFRDIGLLGAAVSLLALMRR